MSSDGDVPMADADAGKVLDAIATSTHASDAQHHPTTESALASDAQQHIATESALLASEAQQHPAAGSALAAAATAPAKEAAPPEPDSHFLDLRGDDAAGSFLDCEDLEEQNQRLRAELDATTKELEWKMDKIAELQELEKVGSCHFSPEL
ncbi:hypothetical protein CFC21_045856 [Triticum aestivum]|uniref:Uncharacterized protein n=2 Tax=Triticum aestivum TaxID=4565 RepID=A0A9R1FVI3_WHEAT|nr:hypothetical protein CFC21_045856 [Triticum aestivum]